MSKRIQRQPQSGGIRHRTIAGLHLGDHFIVVLGTADDGHEAVIFRRSPHHSRPADVYVLHGFGHADPLAGDRRLEGIQVDHHHVYHLDAQLTGLLHVIGLVTQSQQPPMYLRMQRDHPMVHDLRKSGIVLDGTHRHASLFELAPSATRREDFDTELT